MIDLFRSSMILRDVGDERMRQERLRSEGKFDHTPDEVSPYEALAMLGEEYGEVARAMLGMSGTVEQLNTETEFYTECIHVAAVAVAMAEGSRRRTGQ